MRKLAALVGFLLLIGMVSWAQDLHGTGQWLYKLWLSDQKAQGQNRDLASVVGSAEYQGFVMGTVQVMWDAGWLNLDGTTLGQWLAVVGRYLDTNPEKWNLPAQPLIYWALYAAWPGEKGSPYLPVVGAGP